MSKARGKTKNNEDELRKPGKAFIPVMIGAGTCGEAKARGEIIHYKFTK